MIAGLPGTGIGGIYYLMCALLMPVFELFQTIKGNSSKKRWKFVSKQFSFACFIFGGFWMVGWIFSQIMISSSVSSPGSQPAHNFFKIQPVFFSLLTLSFVLLNVRLFSFLMKRKRKS